MAFFRWTARTKAMWRPAAAAYALPFAPLLGACTETWPAAIMQSMDATTVVESAEDGAPPDSPGPDASVATEGSVVTEASLDTSAGDDEESRPPADIDAAPVPGSFCALPGSVVWTASGHSPVPGADASTPDITWLKLPAGFCAHYFATVKTARQLKFAPGGELFAASPTSGTTGGRGDGIAGIVVLPDDNHDGNADSNITFLDQLPSVQGLMFANSHFYYQDGTTVRRVPYAAGDRSPSGPSEIVTSMANWPQASEHWPRVFDQARDGTIYISNGSTQGESCQSARPVFGGIFKLNADGSTSEVAKGFRNPIALRCEADHDVCLAVELALDYSGSAGGREKVVPVRQGDDWGFPCCATQDTPYAGVRCADTSLVPDCSGVAAESDGYIIGHTPFGVDFETGQWPDPWKGRAYVTLHGVVGSWEGARVVAIALDSNGMPLPASELYDAGNPNNMLDFATGWDDGQQDHGRPAPVAFAPDGRMFLGDDQAGAVIWIAPVGLMR